MTYNDGSIAYSDICRRLGERTCWTVAGGTYESLGDSPSSVLQSFTASYLAFPITTRLGTE